MGATDDTRNQIYAEYVTGAGVTFDLRQPGIIYAGKTINGGTLSVVNNSFVITEPI